MPYQFCSPNSINQYVRKIKVQDFSRTRIWLELGAKFGPDFKPKMASIYSIKPGELFEVPIDDKTTECKLCLDVSAPSDGIDLGPLYQYGKPIEGSNDVEIYWYEHFLFIIFSQNIRRKFSFLVPTIFAFCLHLDWDKVVLMKKALKDFYQMIF